MDAKLTVVGGKASKSRVSVKLPAVIGRSREADLTVAHPMVSRKHCELYEVDGLLMIRDLGSLNGLYVGGKQVSEAALHPNAEFAVGPLTFRVEYEFAGEIPPQIEPKLGVDLKVRPTVRRQIGARRDAGDAEALFALCPADQQAAAFLGPGRLRGGLDLAPEGV